MKNSKPSAARFLLPSIGLLICATLPAWGPRIGRAQPAAGPAPANALSRDDEQAVRKTIAGVEAAWNAHDMDAYARLLRPDVEWVNVVGMHWKGRDEVMLAHIEFHKTSFKNHNIHTDDVQVRPLCPDYAIAVVTTTNDAFTTPAGNVISKRQDRQTYVLGKERDGWKIVHCENVWVDADAAQHDPVKARKAAKTGT